MPGFPLLNLGTALGGLVKGYDQQQENAQQRQLNAILAQLRQNQLQQVVRDQKARQLLGALAGTPDAAGLFGSGGGQMPQPPMPGQASQSGSGGQAQPPMLGPANQPAPDTPSGDGGMSPVPWKQAAGMSPVPWKQGGMSPVPWKQEAGPTGDVGPEGDIGPAGPQSIPVSDGGFSSPQERRAYYMRLADQRGISRPRLDQLVASEGTWEGKTGDYGMSGGPMQDYMGGGLGNEYKAQTGYDPRDPRHGKALARFDIDQLAKRGFDPNTWHGLRGGGGGGGIGGSAGGGDGGSMPRIAPPIYRPPPQGYDLNNLAAQLRKTNPSIDPETMFSVLDQYQHLMDGPSKDAWERFKFETQNQRHDYEFQVGEQDKGLDRAERERQFQIEEQRLARQDFRSDREFKLNQEKFDWQREHGADVIAGQGWKVEVDPTNNNKPYRFNQRTGEAVDFENKPYTPGGAQNLGSQPRSAPAMYLNEYQKENPQATAAELAEAMALYRRLQSSEASFAGGVSGRNLTALNTVAGHIQEVQQYADALKNNDIRLANTIANKFAVETGKPEVTSFETGRDIMTGEVVRLLTATGGSETDRRNMESHLPANASPEQLSQAIGVFRQMIGDRFKGLEQQYARNDAKRRAEFENNMLSDKAKQVFLGQSAAPAGEGGAEEIPLPDPSIPESGIVYDEHGAAWQRNGDKLRKLPPQ